MLTDKQKDNYAKVLLWGMKKARKKRYYPSHKVLIRFDLPAVGLAEILFEKVLEDGMIPIIRMNSTPVMERRFFELGNNAQLTTKMPGDKELYENIHGSIFINAPDSITHLSGIDPKRIGKAVLSRKYIRDILDKREEEGQFGWTVGIYPTQELASHAGLSMEEYSRQVVRACFLDDDDPVNRWETIYHKAMSIKNWLNSLNITKLHITSKNTDLRVNPGRMRKWVGISGHNIPSFELFISPDWRGTEGVYYADQPSYRSGNYVRGVRLVFQKGNVVEASAEEGEAFVNSQIKMDKGASRIGEFSLTDNRFSMIDTFMANTLYDENYGGDHGNCHIAVGSSYSDTYDGNPGDLTKDRKRKLGFNDSALHWDLVNTEEKKVVAHLKNGDIIPIYENGRFAC